MVYFGLQATPLPPNVKGLKKVISTGVVRHFLHNLLAL